MLFDITLFGPQASRDRVQAALSAAGFAVSDAANPYGPSGPPPYGDGPPPPRAGQDGEVGPPAETDLVPDPALGASWLRAEVDLLHAEDPGPQDFWLRKAGAAAQEHGWATRMYAVRVTG